MDKQKRAGLELFVALSALAFVLAAYGDLARAAPGAGPGGMSRILHVGCGQFCPGGGDWKAEFDDTTLSGGYSYSVDGKAYHGHKPNWFCWFFDRRGSVTIRCPKGVQGTLYLHFVDLGNSSRKQTVTVCGRYTDVLREFFEPAGQWCQYSLSPDDTKDGTILIELVNDQGANAVISRIDFVPAGVKDALAPEMGPAGQTPEALVHWDWVRQEKVKRRRPGCRDAVAEVLDRGEALSSDLKELGAAAGARMLDENLSNCRRRQIKLTEADEADKSATAAWEELYFEARWTVRKAALENPLLNFDELLFVKRHTPSAAHQCSHHVGTSQRPGADVCILKGLRLDGEVRSVLGDQLLPGGIGRPDLSYDATRIVFPYAAPRPIPTPYRGGIPGEQDAGPCLAYQVYEIGVDGSGLRPLTDGPQENTEPCYLPDERICFTSSRRGRFVQCGDWALVFSLYSMNRDGSDVQPITEAKEGEWFPSVLDDGRIIYMRWEYVIKPFNTIQYLWTVNPDGTGARLAYGDHFAFSPGPLTFIEARQIPGTSKVITTGAAHHNCGVGPICIVDLGRNRGNEQGLLRVTPEVGYPETSEMANTICRNGWYNAPYPLSEKYFLVCYSFEPNHNAPAGYGIYLMDVHGNKELIFRDPERSCYSPIPLKPRSRPAVLPPVVAVDEPSDTGTLILADVYRGLAGVRRGTVKYLRVLKTIPKDYHSTPQRLDIGIGSGWDPRAVLGTVPIEEDGSACFQVPADTPVFFEALDENYMDVRRMRSYLTVKPNETVSCVGCHESYNAAPTNVRLIALEHPPREITPPPWGATPMAFSTVVQPVLDRYCIRCHDGTSGKDRSFDLTSNQMVPAGGADNHYPPAPSDPYRVTASFANLLPHVDFIRLNGYVGGNLPLEPYAVGSHRSKLVDLLDDGHYDVELDADSRRAIVTWIDCNAPFLGGWDEYAERTIADAVPDRGTTD